MLLEQVQSFRQRDSGITRNQLADAEHAATVVRNVNYSKNIRALLNAAEKRIQAGGGIEHGELWRQIEQG